MRYFLWFMLQPSALIASGIILGAFFVRTRYGSKLLWLSAMALFVFGFLPVGGLVIRPLEQRFESPSTLERVDGVVVLAGAELPELSALSGHSQFDRYTDRLTTFLVLAHRFPNARLVHSGGAGGSDENQSDVARALILGAGIDEARTTFERRSTNTCESARMSFEGIRPAAAEQWLLVTSAAHMPRAVACFRAAGWHPIPYPTDYKQGRRPLAFWLFDNLGMLDYAAHEWLGLAYYRLSGLTTEFFPAPDR
jgi:uncharacterized SAM-binding protein YcdF (DUF218 family)